MMTDHCPTMMGLPDPPARRLPLERWSPKLHVLTPLVLQPCAPQVGQQGGAGR